MWYVHVVALVCIKKKKAVWVRYGEQASLQHPSMASTSLLTFRFLPWRPSMMWKLIDSFHRKLCLMFIPALALMSWTLTSESLISYRDNLHSFTENHSSFVYTDNLSCAVWAPWDAHSVDGIWPSYFRRKHVFVNAAFKIASPEPVWLLDSGQRERTTTKQPLKKCRHCIFTEASCSGVVDQPVTTQRFLCVRFYLVIVWSLFGGGCGFYFVFLALLLFWDGKNFKLEGSGRIWGRGRIQ